MLNERNKKIAIGILKKVFEAGGEPAVEVFVKTAGKDLPPVKLSAKELELLKGGNLSGTEWGEVAGVIFIAGCVALT